MKDKNILNNVGKSVGNGSKATLPNGENLSDKIQQNKVNQGVNGTNKFQSSNNSSLGMDNSNDDKKETKSKEEQAVGNVASEALKTSLKASFPYIPQFVINKLVDSKLGQTLIERQLREIKTKMIFGIIGVVITVLLWLFIMSAMVALIMAPVAWIDDATSNIGDFFGKLGNWFTGDGWCVAGKCNQNAQAKYYEPLTSEIGDAFDKFVDFL